MAQLYQKQVGRARLECYSERGIMSYFMFHVLPTCLPDFLAGIESGDGDGKPFSSIGNPEDVVLFSELDFGNQGFGKPDGAIYFTHSGEGRFIFVEAKLNQTYKRACSPTASYNSTLKGQLELKWRAMTLYKAEAGRVKSSKGIQSIRENGDLVDFYKGTDPFYRRDCGSAAVGLAGRRLRLANGVKRLFDTYISRCRFENIFYLAVTNDEMNPFSLAATPLPLCADINGKPATNPMRQFCWIRDDVLKSWNP